MDAMYWVYTSRFNTPDAEAKLSPPKPPSPSPAPARQRAVIGALLQLLRLWP